MKVKIKTAVEIESSCIEKNGNLVDKTNSRIIFFPDMRKYCGKESEVKEETDEGFVLKIDAGLNLWLPHWVEEVK